MKLFYYRFPTDRFPKGLNNFGDDLNPWLWDRLLPDILDDDESTAFVGIGTLLNKWLPGRVSKARTIVVFGSGAGYGDPPTIDASWKIYWVRGPLSAERLGLSSELAITDGALLVRRVYQSSGKKAYPFAYMPHALQAEQGGRSWAAVCRSNGFGFIDPRWSVDRVLEAISQTEVLLTEAMHGAIVADALRVPWIPVRTTKSVLSFKWQDWCSSVNVEYRPVQLDYLSDQQGNIISSARQWLKIQRASSHMAHIARTQSPYLSDDAHIERLTVQLEEKLDGFRKDWSAGYFAETQSNTSSFG